MNQTNFESRRKTLSNLSDEELRQRFWDLTEKLVSPLLGLAKCNTTPSIERSVLLRMGFSSLQAKAIVDGVIDHGLMGKGAGHVVYKLAKAEKISIHDSGCRLIEGDCWGKVSGLFQQEDLG